MKDKIIKLIEIYRAENESYWNPVTSYMDGFSKGYSIAYGHVADDLEALLKSMKGGPKDENKEK